jgi:transcriptional regulator with XRE-family HTH domain
MIKNNIHDLLKEKNLSPLVLVRPGVSQGTAYRLANATTNRHDAATLDAVCAALSDALGRFIDVGDVLQRIPFPLPETGGDAGMIEIVPCAVCGQKTPDAPGIGGEYPCPSCGLMTLHDAPVISCYIIGCDKSMPHEHSPHPGAKMSIPA